MEMHRTMNGRTLNILVCRSKHLKVNFAWSMKHANKTSINQIQSRSTKLLDHPPNSQKISTPKTWTVDKGFIVQV